MPSLSDTSEFELSHVEIAELLQASVEPLLGGTIHSFKLIVRDEGLVLAGVADSYYTKQQAQYAVMRTTGIPILSNDIVVIRPPSRLRPGRD